MGRKVKNRTGKTFGRFTAISFRRGKYSGKPCIFWVCLCNCGFLFETRAGQLISGKLKFCPNCSFIKNRKRSFWNRVAIGSDSDCWLWLGDLSEWGYGVFSVNHVGRGAHRVAYEYANGPIPEGMKVCHRCDVPPCVNPAHLFLGTHQDNMDDKVSKGRQPTRFTGSVRAKLIGENYNLFSARILAGEKPFRIAKEFGIHYSTACKIAQKLFTK